jgi:formylglycine-generating enzyme required for sulfatase activity
MKNRLIALFCGCVSERWILSLSFALLAVLPVSAEPVVSNVRAAQRSGANVVDIYYDLASAGESGAVISVEVSENGGGSYVGVTPGALSGDRGSGVINGRNRHIVWDAGVDKPDFMSTAMRFQIQAEAPLPTPAGMVRVEGGTLAMSMGTMTVSTFYIGQTEVTWGEWQTVRTWATSNGYDIGSRGAGGLGGLGDDYPVNTVAWYDVLKWCNAKSERDGLTPVYSYNGSTYRSGQPSHLEIAQNLSASGYRLPREAEWEFAARGGNQTHGYTYSGSNSLISVGWYVNNSVEPQPVGQKAANELGLHDMSGNVWEWSWDRYSSSSSTRCVRGGSSFNSASNCTVSIRAYGNPDARSFNVGLRLARSSVP